MAEKYFIHSRVSLEKKLLIVRLFARGKTETAVSAETGVSRRAVYSIFKEIRRRISEQEEKESSAFFRTHKINPRKLIDAYKSLTAESENTEKILYVLCFQNRPAYVEVINFSVPHIYDLKEELMQECGTQLLSDVGFIAYPIWRFRKSEVIDGKGYLRHYPDSLIAFRYFLRNYLKKFKGITSGNGLSSYNFP